MSECPCRQCRSSRSDMWMYHYLSIRRSVEEQIADARKAFITDRPRWSETPWMYTLEWFECEVDELLGVTHARHTTQRMREQIA